MQVELFDGEDLTDYSEPVVFLGSHIISPTGGLQYPEYGTHEFIAGRDISLGALPNTPATGTPTISGTAQVGGTLTADTSGITDGDGLDNVSFSYQWLSSRDTEISGATDSTYILMSTDLGKIIKVRLSFTDDAGNSEELTSAATGTVAAAPLTATVHDEPASHDGQSVFTFELRFSESPKDDFSYKTLRDHAFLVTGGEVTKARRLTKGSNIGWEITVTPNSDANVSVVLPVTTDCNADGAICTGDGRMLSEEMALTVSGPAAAASNSPATGAPTITGTAQVGETLTASTTGIFDTDGLTNVSYAYQWLTSRDAEIDGATGSTYTLVSADVGKAIKVKVSFTDDADNEETLTSAVTAAVVGAESDIEPNVGYVTVVVQENNSGPDTPATDFTVTWNDPEECSDGYSAYISGWVGSVLDLGSTDSDGTQIAKTVPQSDLEGGMGYNVEVYCGVRDPGWYIEPAHVPEYGPSHTPVPGTYSSEPGLTGLTVTEGSLAPSFHQYRFVHTLEDVPSDATRITLNATAKAGHSVVVLGDSVTVMGSCNGWECEFTYEEAGSDNKVEPLKDADEDLGGFQMDLADDQTHFSIHVPAVSRIGRVYRFSLDRLTPEPLTVPGGQDGNTQATGLPAISGTAQVGQSLVADTSGIDDADGLTNVSYSYQWIRSDGNTDTDITGATGSTYTLVSADVGKAIKVKVSFTDDAGNQETLTSAATAAVAATAPGVPQRLSVSPLDAGALNLDWEAPGSDGGSPVTGYRVQWKQASGSWDTPGDVSEETVTGTSHTLTGLTGGVEYTIRVIAGNSEATARLPLKLRWRRRSKKREYGPQTSRWGSKTNIPAIPTLPVSGPSLKPVSRWTTPTTPSG